MLLTLSLPLAAYAGTLSGHVEGKDGEAKPSVRVDLTGPDTKVAFTDADGNFKVELEDGTYVVLITENRRRMEFKVTLPLKSDEPRTFRLNW